MTFDSPLFVASSLFAFGICLGALIVYCIHRIKSGNYKQIAQNILHQAQQEAINLKKHAELSIKQMQLEHQREQEQTWQQERKKIQREEDRLKSREDKLETRLNLVEKKLTDIEKREAVLIGRKAQLEEEKNS
ncbi:hypothetical protein DB43_EI00340 [Parachlamydia acanthamoebae]|uniref:Ribonuclease Y N-terminal domain-containing protein n=1 Tax=Parachlamydia acanthamoebae TaxID=83552 RepID=A0A0C1EPX1_9BACT|nr:Rnase Y domain-containing protein [Parachlamydia acanthamoebae]KIA78289.1 hypothetical protein DB43_EI00340 [Parachlamydia acanthamoebae]